MKQEEPATTAAPDVAGVPARRPFGRTDMEITAVGIGTWAIGGGGWSFGWGQQDDAESVATIRHAVERGINWIDTAAMYGLGHAEEVVRRAVAPLPPADRPFIFTKCGLGWDDAHPEAKPIRRAAGDVLRRDIDASLRRLGVERVDLLQLHWPPDDGTPIEEYWGVLLDIKAQGKARAVALCNHSAEQLARAEAVGHVDAFQPPFSMIDRVVASDALPWCHAHGTGTIVYSPMQSGLLTGAFTAQRVADLPADDWRRRAPDFTDRLAANLELSDALEPIAERHGVSRAAVAVAWTLAWPGVTAAIVGARRPDQVDDWLAAGSLRLDHDDLTVIAQAIERTGAGSGPVRS